MKCLIWFALISAMIWGGCKGKPSPRPNSQTEIKGSINSQTSNPKTEIPKDRTQPTLVEVYPKSGDTIAGTPRESINIYGIAWDDSMVKEIFVNDQKSKVYSLGNQKYKFEVNLKLKPGKNSYRLDIIDKDGNRLKQEISFTNGYPSVLIIDPEYQMLPTQGEAHFKVRLLIGGKDIPIFPEDVHYQAQKGHFEKNLYKAPSQACTDTITATYKNDMAATAKYSLTITHPDINISLKAPDVLILGEEATLRIMIENNSGIPLINTTLKVGLSLNLRYISSIPDGVYSDIARELEWKQEKIKESNEPETEININGEKIGNGKVKAVFTATGIGPVQKEINIEVHEPIKIFQTYYPKIFNQGDEIIFQLEIQNIGKSVLERVIIKDTLPQKCSYIESAPCDGTYSDHNVIFPMISVLSPGNTGKYQIKLKIEAQEEATNIVEVCFATLEGVKKSVKNELKVNPCKFY